MYTTTDFFIRLVLASLFGAMIGLERELRAKEAGTRTHFLVAMGSALFTILSQYGFDAALKDYASLASFDPSRIAAQVVTGIGFIGAGEQAKLHLLGLKAARPGLKVCKLASKYPEEETVFIRQLSRYLPDMQFIACNGNMEAAMRDSDILVTATSAQAPLLKADWIKEGAFYSHIGGWEDEYAVVQKADKIVCDDWQTVKHRTQTVSRCYKDGVIGDSDIYANIVELLDGSKPGRENEKEFIYFNAVGLAYTDISIAYAMYTRAREAGKGHMQDLQGSMIFDKTDLKLHL